MYRSVDWMFAELKSGLRYHNDVGDLDGSLVWPNH